MIEIWGTRFPESCLTCKKFWHMSKCCNDVTRTKARMNKEDKVRQVEEDGVQEAKAIRLYHVTTPNDTDGPMEDAKNSQPE